MAFAILRFDTFKKQKAVQLLAHNSRTDNRSRDNIDETRSVNNIIEGYTDGNDLVASEADCPTQQPNGRKIRSDAVHYGGFILSASPEFFGGEDGNWSAPRVRAWKALTEKFIATLPGKNVHLAWHFDEKTPHVHVLQLAVDDKNHLSKKALFGGKTVYHAADRLREFHDQYAEVLAPLGISRGVAGSTRSYAKRPTKMREEAIKKASRWDTDWQKTAGEWKFIAEATEKEAKAARSMDRKARLAAEAEREAAIAERDAALTRVFVLEAAEKKRKERLRSRQQYYRGR